MGVADCLPPGPLVVSRVTTATSPRLAAEDPPDQGDSRAEGVCSLFLVFPLPVLPFFVGCGNCVILLGGGTSVCLCTCVCVWLCGADVCGCVFRVLFWVLSLL